MSHTPPTPSDVQEVLDTTLDTTSLQAHIDAAAHEVDDINDADATVSDSRLTDIHKYLAAWYSTGQDPRASSQSAETRSISYATEENADYYAVAKRLDPTGVLERNAKPTASVSVPDSKGVDS